MRRFISFLLMGCALNWAFGSNHSVHHPEKNSGQYLVVQAESSPVPELTKRPQKCIAATFNPVDRAVHIVHWRRTLSWSPRPDSFCVSRFVRDIFYTFISINAP